MAAKAATIELIRTHSVDLATISAARLHEMATAAEEVEECRRVLAKTGGNVVGELLRGVEKFYEWDHYPDGDIYDFESHSQYYYHSHPQSGREQEHGHFHTFMRPRGMPVGIRPAPVDDLNLSKDENSASCHLVGISMDAFGMPIRLFTTNRWVTGETWYGARDVKAMLDGFRIDHAQPSWPLNRWITALVRLFRPQIENLIEARDATVASRSAVHLDSFVFEDRTLEIASVVDVDLEMRIANVTVALQGLQ